MTSANLETSYPQVLAELPQDIYVAADIQIRYSLVDKSLLQITWGEGSHREEFETDSAELAALLMTLDSPTPANVVLERMAMAGISNAEAVELIGVLLGHHLFSAEPFAEVSEAEKTWVRLGWQDALMMHRATRNTLWRHDYPPNPQVMTWFFHDTEILPDTPRPEIADIITDDTLYLPDATEQLTQVNAIEAIHRRRTHRNFEGTTLTLDAVSDLLHWAFRPIIPGATRKYFTTLSSADGFREKHEIYPISVHVYFDPAKFPAGFQSEHTLFTYNPRHHALVPISSQRDPEFRFSRLLWDQEFADGAPMMLILGINWDQFMWKYRSSHAYRMAHYDLGAYMQTAMVIATGLGLRTFITPAIDDDRFARLLGTTESQYAPSYVLAVGAAS